MNVFIAHSVRDREMVATLVTVLGDDGHEVFLPAEMAASGQVLSAVSAAIRSADVLVRRVEFADPLRRAGLDRVDGSVIEIGDFVSFFAKLFWRDIASSFAYCKRRVVRRGHGVAPRRVVGDLRSLAQLDRR